jgi:hypothetical protein
MALHMTYVSILSIASLLCLSMVAALPVRQNRESETANSETYANEEASIYGCSFETALHHFHPCQALPEGRTKDEKQGAFC